VLGSELDIKITRGKLELQRDAYVTDDVTVLISLVGDVWGVAILSISFDTAKAFISKMLGQEIKEFNELAQSGIGELGNVVTGQASTRLAALGVLCQISVPTLIVGKGSKISTLDIDRLIVPLESDVGVMRLNLALRENPNKTSWPIKPNPSGLQMAVPS
jgi:chemotaxis protein CheX